MPTYEYKCEACGEHFDLFQSITAKPIRKCPKCGKSRAKRLIGSGAGLIFKGSGFYITDYRDSAYKSDSKSDSGKPAETKTTDAKPAETKSTESPATPAKPAAKTETPAPAKEKSSKRKSE